MNLRTLFRVLGLLEGLSFIALLGIAMPMKYILGVSGATQVPGMVHGILFLAYLGMALQRSDEENWPTKKLFLAVLASIFPLGTFVFDYKFLSPKLTQNKSLADRTV